MYEPFQGVTKVIGQNIVSSYGFMNTKYRDEVLGFWAKQILVKNDIYLDFIPFKADMSTLPILFEIETTFDRVSEN